MNPAPSGRHARIEAQLLAILQGPATAAGLTVVGRFNLGEDEHDYRVPGRARAWNAGFLIVSIPLWRGDVAG